MRDEGHLPAKKEDDFATKADMREQFAAMRDDIITAIRDMIHPLALAIARNSAELADIRGYMKDKLVTRDEFDSRMDRFARPNKKLES